MPRTVFLPLYSLATITLLVSLSVPSGVSADQVEETSGSEEHVVTPQVPSADNKAVAPSVWDQLLDLIGAVDDDEAQASSASTPESPPPARQETAVSAVTSEAAQQAERPTDTERSKTEAVGVGKGVEKAAADKAPENGKATKEKGEEVSVKAPAEKVEREYGHTGTEKVVDLPDERNAAAVETMKAGREKPADNSSAGRVDPEKTGVPAPAETTIPTGQHPSAATAASASTATAKDLGSDMQPSSAWRNLLAFFGLYDNRETIPPLEVKNTPLQGEDYIIGPGDVLGISVWRDDSLTRTVVVLPDGKIQFPLAGEIVAGGKSVNQLKREVVGKLSDYIVDADVSVEVKQSNSLFVYIIGKVNSPGRQMLVADTSVLQALAMAGGLNPYAEKDDIKIFRRDKDRTTVYSFRYSQVVSGSYLDDNVLLKRGDVIVVP